MKAFYFKWICWITPSNYFVLVLACQLCLCLWNKQTLFIYVIVDSNISACQTSFYENKSKYIFNDSDLSILPEFKTCLQLPTNHDVLSVAMVSMELPQSNWRPQIWCHLNVVGHYCFRSRLLALCAVYLGNICIHFFSFFLWISTIMTG